MSINELSCLGKDHSQYGLKCLQVYSFLCRIAVDPIFPPPMNFSSTYKYNIPENALHYNKFELIFDEERDGAEMK